MTESNKQKIQYSTAIGFLISGICMCFIAFFLDEEHIINSSVLWYMGQAVVFTSAVFGIDVYIRQQVHDAERRITDKMHEKIDKIEKR